MLFAYAQNAAALRRLTVDEPLEAAVWIDLYRPTDPQAQRLREMGVEVPTLSDMEEIEISNRLYRENGMDVMTVVLPGLSLSKTPISGPVSFILTPERLVTVRHHAPRPFETFPDRADKSGIGCASPDQVFLGLVDEVIGRLADLLEGAGKALDEVSAGVFQSNGAPKRPEKLQAHLEQVGREGDLVGRVRLSRLS